MTKTLALELGPLSINVNCIAPGPFMTDMPLKALSEEQKSRVAEAVPLGRWGKPRELGGPAVFLASDAGSYVNGSTLVFDAGLTARAY